MSERKTAVVTHDSKWHLEADQMESALNGVTDSVHVYEVKTGCDFYAFLLSNEVLTPDEAQSAYEAEMYNE